MERHNRASTRTAVLAIRLIFRRVFLYPGRAQTSQSFAQGRLEQARDSGQMLPQAVGAPSMHERLRSRRLDLASETYLRVRVLGGAVLGVFVCAEFHNPKGSTQNLARLSRLINKPGRDIKIARCANS